MTIKEKLTETWFRFYRKLEVDVHPLRYIFWEATLKCNLNCRHCGSDCTKDEKFPELETDKVLSVFKDIASHYNTKPMMIVITGGEPLMRKDLFPLMKEFKKLGFRLGMVTNGLGWKKKDVAAAADIGVECVTISLDGLEENHNWLRNNPHSFERAVETIRMFVNVRKVPLVEPITVVYPRNFNELDKIYDFVKKLHVPLWRVVNIFPTGRAVNNKDLLLSPSQYKELVLKVMELRKRGEKENLRVNFSDEGYLGPCYEKKVRDWYYFCRAGINVAGLLADGSVSACPNLPREWIQGNINETSFSEIWEKKFKKYRDRSWMKNSFCNGCEKWNVCFGNSLHTFDLKEHKPKICHYKIMNS